MAATIDASCVMLLDRAAPGLKYGPAPWRLPSAPNMIANVSPARSRRSSSKAAGPQFLGCSPPRLPPRTLPARSLCSAQTANLDHNPTLMSVSEPMSFGTVRPPSHTPLHKSLVRRGVKLLPKYTTAQESAHSLRMRMSIVPIWVADQLDKRMPACFPRWVAPPPRPNPKTSNYGI